MGRSPSCSSSQSLKKGPWTPEEDQILTEYIHNHGGHGSWRALPKRAGLNRCGKSCRLRWCNYLRPDIKRGKFSENEEQMIISLHSALGNKWSQIAAHLPGRTDNEIKNFWNTHIRKKLLNIGIDPKTHQPICDLNNFLVNFYPSMLSNSNLSANLLSRLDSTLTRLKSYLIQPAANTQLLLNLWQLINSTNPLPNTIEESRSLLQSAYNLSQCGGLINGTSSTPCSVDGGTFQESSVFQNMHVSPQFASENVATMNSSTFFGDEFRPEVVHGNTTNCSIRSSVERENVLPALVSASGTPETFGINQNDSTFIPTDSDIFEDWETLVDNEDRSSNSFWKDFIGFPL